MAVLQQIESLDRSIVANGALCADHIAVYSPPVSPDMRILDVADLFHQSPDQQTLAVVRDGRPVGVVRRNDLFALLAKPLALRVKLSAGPTNRCAATPARQTFRFGRYGRARFGVRSASRPPRLLPSPISFWSTTASRFRQHRQNRSPVSDPSTLSRTLGSPLGSPNVRLCGKPVAARWPGTTSRLRAATAHSR